MEDNERTMPDSDEMRRETDEDPDVEGHRKVLRADDETDEMRRETDEDPDVEGHRVMPRTEIGRTEIGRTETGRTEI